MKKINFDKYQLLIKKCGVSTINTDKNKMKHKTIILSVLAILMSVNTAMAQTIPSYVPTSGLVGWWPFNANANDESCNGNDGVLYGALLCHDRNFQDSSAFYFGGNNQQIRWDNDTSLTNHSDLTISAWFKVDNRISGWHQNVMISNLGWSLSSGGFQLHISNPPNAYIEGVYRNSTFWDQVLTTNGMVSIDTSTWYHVVYSIEYYPSIDSTLANIYLNNVLINQQYLPQSIVYTNISSTINVGVNVDSIGYERAFKGKIDDIGIWNRAITPSEVSSLFQSPTGLSELSNSKVCTIYPNPASCFITVDLHGTNDHDLVLNIYSLMGNVVHSETLNQKQQQINLGHLHSGIYMIEIKSKEWSEKQKLIIQR
jgi:hypothetical protein